MSPVGHSLVGATLGMLLVPRVDSTLAKAGTLVGMVLLANLPDLPFPGWGHDRYDVSHSLPIGLCIVIAATVSVQLSTLSKSPVGSWLFLVVGAAAVCSHYLLDSFYNHGKGVAIWWPFSDGRLVLPIPWLSHMHTDPLFSWHNAKVWGLEFLTFGILFLLSWIGRWRWSRSD